MKAKHLVIFTLSTLIFSLSAHSQNLPSLLTEKNINATFSIVGYDEAAQEWGIAVATDNLYVGNSTIYIQPGVGAFSVIAETEPRYGIVGLQKLKEGQLISEVIKEIREADEGKNYRQVSGIDAKGEVFAFTGKSLKFWNGQAKEVLGKNYAVMGNQLADGVLTAMANAFESTKGTLAKRLLASLVAGQQAGGQLSGKQSAALVVKGTNNAWYNQIDLRVDHSKTPIRDLQRLMDYHYGRITLNQALYAARNGNVTRALKKLVEAEEVLIGWTGMYSRLAFCNYLLKDEAGAAEWVQRGLDENPNWSVNLPSFYFLRDHPKLKKLIQPDQFTVKDWENALQMLSNLGREVELIQVAERLLDQKMESSYLHFLLGSAYYFEKENKKAIDYLQRALQLDQDNVEAQALLEKVTSQ